MQIVNIILQNVDIYDGGDCCESTCDPDYSFYTCGANQPYECLSEEDR
jgi:hypothetical protein